MDALEMFIQCVQCFSKAQNFCSVQRARNVLTSMLTPQRCTQRLLPDVAQELVALRAAWEYRRCEIEYGFRSCQLLHDA